MVWVRLGDKTNHQFGFLCVEGTVLGYVPSPFVAVCFALSTGLPVCHLNVTFFRRLGFHWVCVCSAPSKVQFGVYCHWRFSVWNAEVVTDTVLLLCLRNMKACSNKQW